MKIAIVGAGIVGITTAWELASDGHEVRVFERRGAAAGESSFANAGMVAPGCCLMPWAAPGMRARMLGSLIGRAGPVRLRWPLGARELDWLRRWRRACQLETHLAQHARLHRLALYSRQRLRQVTAARELEYERSDGCLVLLRGERDRRLAQPGLDVLRAAGTVFRELDADAARRVEPALNPATPLAGAIHLPDDEVANCRQFALLLKREAERLGAEFHFDCDIAPLERAAPRALSLAAGSASHAFDAVVVRAGVDSRRLLAPLGLHLPLAPLYGYSITAQLREPLDAPRSAVMDERHQVAIARLGWRVRVAGGAELGGVPGRLDAGALRRLHRVLQDWFPGAAALRSGVQSWKGARPMLPDGPPVLGASGVPGIWLNLGHGANGWALACGSARVLADLIGGRDAGIDLEGLGVERLG